MGINLDAAGYNEVSAANPGEFLLLPAGGYVCRIFNSQFVKSKAGNDLLVLYLDIAEGEFAGHFKAAANRVKNFNSDLKWDNAAIYRQRIFDDTGRVARFFKGLLSCIAKSNKTNFNLINFEADSLRGLLCGFIFAEEEYNKKDGSIATRTFAKFPKIVDDIRNGNFNIPELKKLSPSPKTTTTDNDFPNSTPIDPDDCPF